MNDWRTVLALVFVLYILLAYIIEVILGSRPGLFNAEIGKDAGCGKRIRLSNREFFFRYVPCLLGIVGFLLLIAKFS